MTVSIGDKAPDFDLPTNSDSHLSLKDLKGTNVVLKSSHTGPEICSKNQKMLTK